MSLDTIPWRRIVEYSRTATGDLELGFGWNDPGFADPYVTLTLILEDERLYVDIELPDARELRAQLLRCITEADARRGERVEHPPNPGEVGSA